MSQVESFATTPLETVIKQYLYQQYADDDTLQSFVDSFNALAQGYLDWFIANPLGLYTSAGISGPLLDWVAQGVYNLDRPVLATQSSEESAGYDSAVYNTVPYNYLSYSSAGTAQQASDDVYKRMMTWTLYRGDGQVFSLQWLKNRVARFLHGANGSDVAVLDYQPSIVVSDGEFTITDFSSSAYTALQLCYQAGFIAFPFQYTPNFVSVAFANTANVLTLAKALYFPTSSAGLPPGAVWLSGSLVYVVPGATPEAGASPLLFASTDPNMLLTLGGGNLPTSNPGVTGQLWNNAGVVNIST